MDQELLLNARKVAGKAKVMGFGKTAQAMSSTTKQFLTDDSSKKSANRAEMNTSSDSDSKPVF